MTDCRRRTQSVLYLIITLATLCLGSEAYAVPAFARQTGQSCVACHVSFPELTSYGRLFKLSGYTIGTRQDIPLAIMAQIGSSTINNNHDDQGAKIQPKNREMAFSGYSIFAAGKVNDHVGGFIQWTDSNLNVAPDGSTRWHSGIDNTDLRFVGSSSDLQMQDTRWIYGVTVHNNPTVQDVWNSTPAFGFPFTAPPNLVSPAAGTQVEGALAQQVAGIGAYTFFDKTWYGELTLYRTADRQFSVLRAGQDLTNPGGVAKLDGYNPYARFAYNKDWGPNSFMLGAFGLRVDRYPDNTITDTGQDRYTDVGIDSQYQYITLQNTFTLQASAIRERQDYRTSFPATVAGNPIGVGPTPENSVDHLLSKKLKATYYFQNKYGATVSYFSINGSTDAGLYAPGSVDGSRTGSPDSSGEIIELDYVPMQNIRLMLQYTAYTTFNGSHSDYDGSGRSARDNNTLFLNAWVAY